MLDPSPNCGLIDVHQVGILEDIDLMYINIPVAQARMMFTRVL
jgi:hypothetical protein